MKHNKGMVKMKATNAGYRNFDAAIYCRVYDVQKMADSKWLQDSFDVLQKHLKISKVYLETHRDMIVPEKELILKIKDFFESRGVKTSAGIAFVASEGQLSRTFCYSNPVERKKVKGVIQFSAQLFDEIMLDDYYFTSCRCELCIKAKGNKSWTSFRLEQLEEAAKTLIIEPARSIKPDVNLIIKYPNWYEHYQFMGYNLDVESKLFDMIYTGTETRDPEYTQQHLQQYQSYAIMRYLENVKPGKNGGGWIDPYARRYLDRWGEQIMLTLFAKPKEVTLFCYGSLLESIKQQDGSEKLMGPLAPVAGTVFEEADSFLERLGQPIGVPSYKPYNSSGEDFLHNYIGMLGIPIDLVPEFPYNSNTVFLAESAKFDDRIVEKIKGQLVEGKTVIITSGLLKALQGRGIEDIIEVECTDKKAIVNEFMRFMDVYRSDTEILIPQIKYATNDAWEIVTCLDKANGYPLLLHARYAKGMFYVLTVPDNFSDLYSLPQEALTQIRNVFMRDFKVQLESPAKICLFTYDNDTFVVESFLPYMVRCNIVVNKKQAKLNDLLSTREWFFGREPSSIARGDQTVFPTFTFPNSYRVYRFE
jgi:hypothetical protein